MRKLLLWLLLASTWRVSRRWVGLLARLSARYSEMGFHHANGIFFKRHADGGVELVVKIDSRDAAPVLKRKVIPPNEWASIVASMSRRGETASTYWEAQRFHG